MLKIAYFGSILVNIRSAVENLLFSACSIPFGISVFAIIAI